MKKLLSLALLLITSTANAAALSAEQVYQLNNWFGPAALQMQLGSKLNTIDTAPAIGAGAVSSAMIAADAVTTIKILDANVTTAKILDANVTTAKIADANVTTAKIADANVTQAKLSAYNVEGLHAKRIARVTYDVATDLGTIGAHALGVTLPAKSIILQTWFYTVTQFVDAGAGTVAISCEDANNLYTATDITGIADGSITAGAADGHAAATFVGNIASACEVTATVAVADQTAGKLVFFIEYIVAE